MASYIPAYKLGTVGKTLVSSLFDEKKTNSVETISKLIYDLTCSHIPEPIMTMFNDVESYFIKQYVNKALCRPETTYFMIVGHINWWSTDGILKVVMDMMYKEGISLNKMNNTIYFCIDLPSPIPCSEHAMIKILLDEIKKKGELYEAFKNYILLENEIQSLTNKIRHYFSSKKFYPGTLKNEFPEAYEVYVKLYSRTEEKSSEPKPTTYDSIESIRETLATLLNNK